MLQSAKEEQQYIYYIGYNFVLGVDIGYSAKIYELHKIPCL